MRARGRPLRDDRVGGRVDHRDDILGISHATYFNWRAKYGGVSVSELKRMKELEAENAACLDVHDAYGSFVSPRRGRSSRTNCTRYDMRPVSLRAGPRAAL